MAISDYEQSSPWGRPAGVPKLDVIVRFQRWARWFRQPPQGEGLRL